MGRLSRNPSELDCFNVLFPKSLWDDIFRSTNSYLTRAKSTGKLQNAAQYYPASIDELKSVLFARLYMISEGSRTINVAYKVGLIFGFIS